MEHPVWPEREREIETHQMPGLGPRISSLVSEPRPREAEGWASSRGSI